ncbi:MAG: SDR family oxidoreductase [Armatimonadetes bacterium]|nr:SDR family oxidoreductase [Armatimonadota bacterium]
MRLQGKKALVTGASRGIGKAIALAYASEGADVAITARRADALAETAAAIRERGRTAYPVAWDLTDVARAGARLAEVKAALGGLDILVNNAGVLRLPADHPAPTPEAEWDYVMDTNLKALFFICRAAAEIMTAQKGGVIINLASDAGLRAAPHPYGISKWGVIGLTKGLARQLVGHGVRVNAIAPGPVATEMMGWHPGKPLDAPTLPLGRYSLPEEIAGVALFLASEDAAAVIGQTLVVNSANT